MRENEPAGQTVAGSNDEIMGRFVSLVSNLTPPELTAEAVSAAMRHRAQRRKTMPKQTEAIIVQTYEQGQGLRAVAEQCGVNRSVVRRVLRQHEVPLRGALLPDHRTGEVRRLYESGLSVAALALRLGVGKTTLLRFMHRNGIERRSRARRAA